MATDCLFLPGQIVVVTLCFVALVLYASSLIVAPARAETVQTVSIEEWTVPFDRGRPRDPSVEPDGAIWFVGQQNHYLARFDVETQIFSQRKLNDGAGPHNLIVGDDGSVWYAGNKRGYIGRFDPKKDIIRKIKMPRSNAKDPHTLVFDHDQSHIWFTVQWGSYVGRLNTRSHQVDLIPEPTADARPFGILLPPMATPGGLCWERTNWPLLIRPL